MGDKISLFFLGVLSLAVGITAAVMAWDALRAGDKLKVAALAGFVVLFGILVYKVAQDLRIS
jgi:hypothetical protein